MGLITTDIDLVIHHLRQGHIAAIPTETVYGLAGNAEDEQAIAKIFALKNRPLNHPLIMHVAPGWDLSPWVSKQASYVQALIDQFWPGPLTIVLPCREGQVNPLVNAGQASVAIRCPSHPMAIAVLQGLGKPLVAPSANAFGKISPTTAHHVQQNLADDDLLILDGGRCTVGIESTIIAALDESGYQILRQGSIDADSLSQVVPDCELDVTQTIRVPGRLANHYQPQKPLYCFDKLDVMKQFCQTHGLRVYVISFVKNEQFADYLGYPLPNDPKLAAYELYYQLHRADQSEAEVIALELPPNTTAWQGVLERAIKAGR